MGETMFLIMLASVIIGIVGYITYDVHKFSKEI